MKKYALIDWYKGDASHEYYDTKAEAFEAAEDKWSRLTREEKNWYLKDRWGSFGLVLREFETEAQNDNEMYRDLWFQEFGVEVRNFVRPKYSLNYYDVKDLGNATKAKESEVEYLLKSEADALKDLIEYDNDSCEVVKGIEWLNAMCEIERRLDAGEYDSGRCKKQNLYDLLDSREIVCEYEEEE